MKRASTRRLVRAEAKGRAVPKGRFGQTPADLRQRFAARLLQRAIAKDLPYFAGMAATYEDGALLCSMSDDKDRKLAAARAEVETDPVYRQFHEDIAKTTDSSLCCIPMRRRALLGLAVQEGWTDGMLTLLKQPAPAGMFLVVFTGSVCGTGSFLFGNPVELGVAS